MDLPPALIGWGILVTALGPPLAIMIYCAATGRLKALFSKDAQQHDALRQSPVLRGLARLALICFPIYVILLILLIVQ